MESPKEFPAHGGAEEKSMPAERVTTRTVDPIPEWAEGLIDVTGWARAVKADVDARRKALRVFIALMLELQMYQPRRLARLYQASLAAAEQAVHHTREKWELTQLREEVAKLRVAIEKQAG